MFSFCDTYFLTVLLVCSIGVCKYVGCQSQEDLPCNPRVVDEKKSKIVCVCNETYCDRLGEIRIPDKGSFVIYTSDKKGQRLNKNVGSFSHRKRHSVRHHDSPYKIKLTVDTSKKFQTLLGFGAAFTDAAGINLASLSKTLQIQLLKSYFGSEGIGYTLGRIPIGGTDFSTRPYTYDDNNITSDMNLSRFSLQKEDLEYKIPFVKLATKLEPDLILYGSPWTAPPWMKTNRKFIGRGMLGKQFQEVWANYIVKFFQEYETHGVHFWGLTTQNEPIDGLIPFFPFNSMGWTPSMQRDWIKNYLGPILHAHGYGNIKLMILDDNTILLPTWVKTILSDPEASQFVSGVGIHWYTRQFSSYDGIRKTLELFPDKFVLATEACTGFLVWEKNVDLGSWERGEEYFKDIIQDLVHGASGWTDWNLALDLNGGPNWVKMGADSPIIVNPDRKEFYKQPMFYSLAHFSKFFTRGSQIISVQMRPFSTKSSTNSTIIQDYGNNIYVVAAVREDHAVVLGLLNMNEFPILVDLFDVRGELGTALFNVSAKSVSTILFLASEAI